MPSGSLESKAKKERQGGIWELGLRELGEGRKRHAQAWDSPNGLGRTWRDVISASWPVVRGDWLDLHTYRDVPWPWGANLGRDKSR